MSLLSTSHIIFWLGGYRATCRILKWHPLQDNMENRINPMYNARNVQIVIQPSAGYGNIICYYYYYYYYLFLFFVVVFLFLFCSPWTWLKPV
jgi:hypothetical protein